MTPYRSTSGKQSGVTGYEIGDTFIVVEFKGSNKYLYTYESAGQSNVEQMKSLALRSRGLSTFVSVHKPKHSK